MTAAKSVEALAEAPRWDERQARVALGSVWEPGDFRLSQLATEIQPQILAELLMASSGTDDDIAARLRAAQPERTLTAAHRMGIRFVVPGDAEWPRQVDDLVTTRGPRDRAGAPLGLWVRGGGRLDAATRSLAIVGTRAATGYGADIAARLAADVAAEGFAIVSGAAFGIDAAAHRGALAAQSSTLAVLACGVDVSYPPAHDRLLAAVADAGVIVSEHAPGEQVTRHRFLSRNRLIAALTLGTLVVEAPHRSGALSTAAWAARLNRAVMGVPGPVTSVQSSGVHHLLRTEGATLVTSRDEILEVIGGLGEYLPDRPPLLGQREDRLTARQRRVLDAFDRGHAAGVLEIAERARLPLLETATVLDQLGRGRLVASDDGGWRLQA